MSSLTPHITQENSAIELFLQMAHDEIYDSEDEVILNFIQTINKEYVTESFTKKWIATYINYIKINVVQKISEELEGRSEEVVKEFSSIATKLISELDNPLYVLALRLNESPVMAEAMAFFEEQDIDYGEIYDTVMSQYAADLFNEIRREPVGETEASPEEILPEETQEEESSQETSPEETPPQEVQSEDTVEKNIRKEEDIRESSKTAPSDPPTKNSLEGLKSGAHAISEQCKKIWHKVDVAEVIGKVENVSFVKSNPLAIKALGLAGVIALIALLLPWGEKESAQRVSEKSPTQVTRPEKGKEPIAQLALSSDVVKQPASVSVMHSVMATELDADNSPQFVSDSFTREEQPLYYHFSYTGELDTSSMEVRLLQNDIEQLSLAQPAIKHRDEKAWMIINETLELGDWVLKLYVDGKVVDFTEFSIRDQQVRDALVANEGALPGTGDSQQVSLAEIAQLEGETGETGNDVGELHAAGDAHGEPAAEMGKPESGLVFVWPSPANSRIRILNIKPKYEHGIKLPPGKYHIEVSANGYKSRKQWINLGAAEVKKMNIVLEPVQVEISPEPVENIAPEVDKAAESKAEKDDGAVSDKFIFDSGNTE